MKRKGFGVALGAVLLAACARGERADGPDSGRAAEVRFGSGEALPAAREAPGELEALARAVRPLEGGEGDYGPLFERIGGRRFVLLGESTHGTEEFYRERARITRRLIEGKGFGAIAVEADWPSVERVDRYVRGEGPDASAREALDDLRRFPRWMWRNEAMVELIEWLRRHNASLPEEARKVGFYGMDMQVLEEAADAVVRRLEAVDRDLARAARRRYACLERSPAGPEEERRCEAAVRAQLEIVRELAARAPGEDTFHALQNAEVVRSAERYFRGEHAGPSDSWNLRDRHMVRALDAISARHGEAGRPGKVVVWAHNSHLGDAGATESGERGEVNVGQLSRQRWKHDVYRVGFTTFAGTVRAAPAWGEPSRVLRVRPGLPGSYERLFHRLGLPRFLLLVNEETAPLLPARRLERAIGVIYRPETERASHYFEAELARQFDAVIHIDRTTALRPIDPPSRDAPGEGS